MKRNVLTLGLLAALALNAQAAEEDLALAYGDAATVSVASGHRQSLRRAPAVASVFSAEDIRAMGATDLSQVLERVPGLHLARSYALYDSMYQFRGAGGPFNQQVLVLVNGLRRQVAFQSSAEDIWIDLPIENIARVEVIRGPGSALYGADAVAGVIAITTKGAADLGELARLQVQAGSFATRAASWQQGWRGPDWDAAAWLRAGRSDGADIRIEADAQTALDRIFGTQASLAPGRADLRQKGLDAGFEFGSGDWRAHLGYKRRADVGDAAGLAQALAQGSRYDNWVANADLGWQRQFGAWELQAQAGLDRQHLATHIVLFPPGAFGGAYPEGMIGEPGRDQRHAQLSLIANYTGWTGHRLRLGVGWQLADMYRTEERKNFNFVFIPGVGNFPAPLGRMVDVSQTGPYIAPARRELGYLLLQDEWQLAQDWALTAGLRHDRYSDFGATTNPRAALVWAAAYNLSLKLLHGRAFRAPSFQELYVSNNPVALGNPNLRPERMRSSELALDWQPSRALQLRANLFRYRMSALIRYLPNEDPLTGTHALNQGLQRSRGGEVELFWSEGDWRFESSLSLQHSRDGQGQPVPEAPRRMLKAGLDWHWAEDWHLHAQGLHVGARQRGPGDARPPVANYSLLDLSLHWRREARQGWQAMLRLGNALDADAREPSPAPGNTPHDFPQPRRHWLLQLSHSI